MSRIADSRGYAGTPGDPRRVERVLEKHGHIKFFLAKHAGQFFPPPKAFMFAVVLVHKETIGITLSAIQIRHPGPRQNNDLGAWPAAADRLQRRNGHHRVPYPVCRSNQNLHACVTGWLRPTAARNAVQKAPSSLSAK